ncbi:MAG: hypothetical protein RBR14_06470 [Candidatus Cloacimonas acidaminovorans]|nr:hypothetical protein [Candidatus Cloacimonas acidaminovorans]
MKNLILDENANPLPVFYPPVNPDSVVTIDAETSNQEFSEDNNNDRILRIVCYSSDENVLSGLYGINEANIVLPVNVIDYLFLPKGETLKLSGATFNIAPYGG